MWANNLGLIVIWFSGSSESAIDFSVGLTAFYIVVVDNLLPVV